GAPPPGGATNRERTRPGSRAAETTEAPPPVAMGLVVEHVVIPLHRSSPGRGHHRAGHPIDLDPCVVHLPQDIRVSILDVDVATLFANDVEQRPTSERVRPTHHTEVTGGDVAHAMLVNLE